MFSVNVYSQTKIVSVKLFLTILEKHISHPNIKMIIKSNKIS